VAIVIQTFTSTLASVQYGVASTSAAGHDESGDRHLVKTTPGGTLLAVVDGSGYGKDAAAPARMAIEVLEANAGDDLVSLVQRCHERLRRTRGAVMSLVAINAAENALTWLGVGNIEGILLRYGSSVKSTPEALPLRPGIVGYRLPVLRAVVTPIKTGDMIILATDGVQPDLGRRFTSEDPPRKIAEYISSRYHKGLDDGLVLAARYQGSGEWNELESVWDRHNSTQE
jgi:phosphoserine phosphatase RsbX